MDIYWDGVVRFLLGGGLTLKLEGADITFGVTFSGEIGMLPGNPPKYDFRKVHIDIQFYYSFLKGNLFDKVKILQEMRQ